MTHPLLLRFLVCTVLLSSLCPLSSGAAPRPNIIFVLLDDAGYGDFGVFFQNRRAAAGNRSEPWMATPKLDTMAAGGIQLRDHYCPAPICAPSRASLLLGVHQGHANIRNTQWDKALENNHTLATVLKSSGYATLAVGKYGLQGLVGDSPANWEAYPTKRGFDEFYGYVRHADGHYHYPFEDRKPMWWSRDTGDNEVRAKLAGCYTGDLWTAFVKKWIVDHQAAKSTQPFFIYLAYDTPHFVAQLPAAAYPSGAGVSGGLQWIGEPGNMINTAGGTPKSWVHPDYASAIWDHDKNPATTEVAWPDVQKAYATSIRRIDDYMGDLIRTLKDLGIDDRTLLVLTNDNGPSVNNGGANFLNNFGPFDGTKGDLWEGGVRVGALVCWPGGIPAGQVSTAPSQFHDWMPTFAELAGVPAPARADGVSLVPTLSNTGSQIPSTVYSEFQIAETTPAYDEFEPTRRGRARNQMQMLRLGDMVGVRHNMASHDDEFEIYQITTDPKQTTNLAASQTALQQQMKDRVLRLRRPDPSSRRPYDGVPVPSIGSMPSVAGVSWRMFADDFPWLPETNSLAGGTTGTLSQPALTMLPGPEGACVRFEGYIKAPADGDYTFVIRSGGRSLLRLHEAVVIDDDFNHASGTERAGAIKLKAGLHPFRLACLHRRGETPTLAFDWSGPGIPRQAVPTFRAAQHY